MNYLKMRNGWEMTEETKEPPTLNNDIVNMVKDYQTIDDEWKIAITTQDFEYVGELFSRKQLNSESNKRNQQKKFVMMEIPEGVPWNCQTLSNLTSEQMQNVSEILYTYKNRKISQLITSPNIILGFFYAERFVILTSSFELIENNFLAGLVHMSGDLDSGIPSELMLMTEFFTAMMESMPHDLKQMRKTLVISTQTLLSCEGSDPLCGSN